MTFNDFLDGIDEAAENGIFHAWRSVYGHTILDFPDIETPDAPQLAAFLDRMQALINAEQKASSPERSAALARLQRFAAQPYTHVPAYAGHELRFIFELALRVREPKIIDQYRAGVCGSNALVIHWARTAPDDFVKRALQLFKHGESQFNTVRLSAPKTAYFEKFARKLRSIADVVVLGAVAKAVITDNLRKLTHQTSGASGGELAHLLRAAGFTTVRNEARTDISGNRRHRRDHVIQCAQEVAAGRLVIMAYNANMTQNVAIDRIRGLHAQPHDPQARDNFLDSGHGQSATGTRNTGRANHVSLLLQLEVLNPDTVRFKLHTWGVAVAHSVLMERFLNYYGGYVSAASPFVG